jgi:ATP-binding cassette subfamily B multidrug efflux pump
MLNQSMSFFYDEFAGRIAAKVMQTALAVRDSWITVADILVYVVVYLVTVAVVVAGFDAWLLAPFVGWMLGYGAALAYFVPRLGRVGADQADARSLMTGRITDAYTNISTIKLFAHASREAQYARSAMEDFMVTARRQSRYVSNFEILNHCLNVLLILSTVAIAITLWIHGHVGLGAVAAATAMALRLNGISHWIMWELASLFENIGTVQDGINTVTRAVAVVDSPHAVPLRVTRGEIRFEHVRFHYGAAKRVIENLSLTINPGEKIGLVGRSGAGKSTLVNLLLRFYAVESGRILIDGQDIALATQESLREQIGMVTQDTSLLHRTVRDNILYGRPQASEAEVRAAARRARADEFIDSLSDARGGSGYDALVGERGVKLSGGTPACRAGTGDAEGCAHSLAGRGERPIRGRGGDSGNPGAADARQDRGCDYTVCPPSPPWTGWWYWMRERSWSRARTSPCLLCAACTLGFGPTRAEGSSVRMRARRPSVGLSEPAATTALRRPSGRQR